jgi:CheY-like chemotaxis protein
MIRILLVEDDADEAHALEGALRGPPDLAIDRAVNAADAHALVNSREYDLIVLDLALPPDNRRLAPRREEGEHLVDDMLREHSGTVLYVLSGHADLHLASQFTNRAGSEDLFGDRAKERMLRFFPKEDLAACVGSINEHLTNLAEVDRVTLEAPSGDLGLSVSEQRAVRILTRRSGGSTVKLDPLGGGLSRAKTFRADAATPEGSRTALLAIKLGERRRVMDEAERYEGVAGLLPVGLGAPLVTTIKAGAGRVGALGYRLADDYDRSLFAALSDDHAASATAQRLAERFHEWYSTATPVAETVQDIRRRVVPDGDVIAALSATELTALRSVDTIEVTSASCMQHGDLHGLNVLVDSRGEPVVIDYGEVGRANPSLDPVTLELSAIFHPAAPDVGWLAVADIEGFFDDGGFKCACPYAEFFGACRAWSAAAQASEEERAATALAYAVRQLKYPNPTAPLARALMRAALEQFS